MVTQFASAGTAKSDRIPPYSESAEQGVLGSALVESERVVDLCIERKLIPDSFYIVKHRALYEALQDMHAQQRPIDLLTVTEFLRDSGRLDEIGGSTYLETLVDGTPTTAHAEHYITIVHQKHLLRTIIERAREAIDACYEGQEDAESVVGQTEQAFFEIGDQQYSAVIPWSGMVKHGMEEIEKIYTTREGLTGLPTGFTDLERKLQGLHPGDMIILAARPSMGKTSLALNIAENIAVGTRHHEAVPVAIFSLEMSWEQLVRRMLCCRARVPSHKLSGGFISEVNHGELVQAADALRKAPMILDDSAGLSVLELRSRARRMKRKHDIQLIVVDYLQLLNYPQYAKEGRQRETAAISGALKAMAKELKIPVLVLSQLSRAPETRDKLAVPKLSDLRDSGSIEQDADVVLLLRRPCKYPDDEESGDETLAVIDVAKHRNGPTGECRLNFEDEYTRFDNRAQGVDRAVDMGEAPEDFEL